MAPQGSILIENRTEDELHAKLERLSWVDQAARARVVRAMPGFRRDFSDDILRLGMALKVARVGLFLSDLTGSTIDRQGVVVDHWVDRLDTAAPETLDAIEHALASEP